MVKPLVQSFHRFPTLSALLLGMVGALGFAPLYLWPLTLLSLTGFYLLLHKKPAVRTCARIGFAYGFGLFAASLWWMGSAFRFTGADWSIWLAPIAIGALIAYMSLFTLLTAVLWRKFGVKGGAFSFAGFWLLGELLRGALLYGFPWGYIGYALTNDPLLMAPAALGGVWLLGALMALLGAALASKRQSIVAALLVVGIYIYAPTTQPAYSGESVALTLLQTDIPQGEKWLPQKSREYLGMLMGQSLMHTPPHAQAVIWPETALPITSIQPDALVYGLGRQMDKRLIAGVVRAELGDELQETEARFFNSLVAANSAIEQGAELPTQIYDKNLLVPFGEFMPLAALWPKGVRNLVQGGLSFTGGDDVAPLRVTENADATPLICYEATFPHFVLRHSVNSQMLLNVTNDGWFNGTTGPAQHMAMARLRAVETGLPLVRVANQGVTTVIDGRGQIIYSAPRHQTHAATVNVPLSENQSVLLGFYRFLQGSNK